MYSSLWYLFLVFKAKHRITLAVWKRATSTSYLESVFRFGSEKKHAGFGQHELNK